MRVLLLNPPFMGKYSRSSRSPAVTKGGTIYYPLWLAYATGVLEDAGFEAKLLDAPAEGKGVDEVLRIAAEFRPELLVMDTSTGSIHSDVEVLGKIKEKLKDATECFAVLVGTHPSALPGETLKIGKAADAIARREYDYTILELAREIERVQKGLGKAKKPKLALGKIEGLSWRNLKTKKITHNKDRGFIKNLDELPFVSEVYKKHLNIRNYFYSANLYPEITIVTGRGCPYRCKFCVWPQVLNGRAYRARSVANVIAEFEYIRSNFPQVREVFIEDDTFTADRARVKEFCAGLAEKKIKITWSCNARADVDYETLRTMKKAGCRLLCVGVESGVQEILNNIHKGTQVGKIGQFFRDTKRAGILVHGCFMLGNQGENKETIARTIEFAKELNPDTAQFFPIMVYPGTETYTWAKKNKYLMSNDFRDWLNAEGGHNCMVCTPELSAGELVKGCNRARKEFYLRPKYVASKAVQAVMHPREAKRILKAGRTFLKHLRGKE